MQSNPLSREGSEVETKSARWENDSRRIRWRQRRAAEKRLPRDNPISRHKIQDMGWAIDDILYPTKTRVADHVNIGKVKAVLIALIDSRREGKKERKKERGKEGRNKFSELVQLERIILPTWSPPSLIQRNSIKFKSTCDLHDLNRDNTINSILHGNLISCDSFRVWIRKIKDS